MSEILAGVRNSAVESDGAHQDHGPRRTRPRYQGPWSLVPLDRKKLYDRRPREAFSNITVAARRPLGKSCRGLDLVVHHTGHDSPAASPARTFFTQEVRHLQRPSTAPAAQLLSSGCRWAGHISLPLAVARRAQRTRLAHAGRWRLSARSSASKPNARSIARHSSGFGFLLAVPGLVYRT